MVKFKQNLYLIVLNMILLTSLEMTSMTGVYEIQVWKSPAEMNKAHRNVRET